MAPSARPREAPTPGLYAPDHETASAAVSVAVCTLWGACCAEAGRYLMVVSYLLPASLRAAARV